MRSDTYTIVFTTIVTVVLGLGLSITADSLRERQSINEELDIKKNILSVLGFNLSSDWGNDQIQSLYEKNINELIVDKTGSILGSIESSNSDNYKIYQSKDNDKVTGYAIPIAGKGLWGTMYGYFAIEPDAETVKGITFYRHKETPGLGAEVDNPKWKTSWKGKKIYDDNQVTLKVIKGKVEDGDTMSMYKVDGLSGATITSRGVSNMVSYWFSDSGYANLLKELNYES